MTPRQKMIIHAAGLVLFAAIVVVAFYRAPPDVSRLRIGWLALAIALSAVGTLIQGLQNVAFMRQENASASLAWSVWFASEKAWMNSILPAKAGTAGAIMMLHKRHGLSWSRYVRFMVFCSGTNAVASVAALIVMLSPGIATALLAAVAFVILTAALRLVYRLTWGWLYALGVLGLVNLAVLSAGVGACIRGLGYAAGVSDIAPIGVALNLLSIVAITPGNFGVREAALSLLTPLMPLGFSVVIQGSTCYVFSRLITTLGLATMLRGHALRD